MHAPATPADRIAGSSADLPTFERARWLVALYEQTPNPVYVLDTRGRIVSCNPACERALGATEAALVGTRQLQRLPPERRQAVADALRSALRGQDMAFSVDMTLPDGTPYSADATALPVRIDGRVVGVHVVHRDRSGLHDAERRAREGDELGRLAGSVARLGGWSVDLATRHVRWSEETARIHETPPGYEPDIDHGIAFYAPEHRATIAEAFGRCAEHGEPYDVELQIVTARGRRVWVRAAGRAERDAEGRVVRIHGAFQDIDDGCRQRLALQRLNRLYALQGGIAEAIVGETGDALALLQRACQVAVERGGFAFAHASRRTAGGRSLPLCSAGDDGSYAALVGQRHADPGFTSWPVAAAIAAGEYRRINSFDDADSAAWRDIAHARDWHGAAVLPLADGERSEIALVLFAAEPDFFGADEDRLLIAIGQSLARALAALRVEQQRHDAEDALRRSSAELALTQRIAGVGRWTYDPVHDALHVSDAAMRAIGMGDTGFDGSGEAFLEWVHPQDRDHVRAGMRRAAQGQAGYDIEYRIVRSDGGQSWIHARADAEPGGGPIPLQVGSVVDITGRKQAELRLREQLERMQLLTDITRAIGGRLELDATLRIVAERIAMQLPASLALLLLRDGAWLRPGAAAGAAAAAVGRAIGIDVDPAQAAWSGPDRAPADMPSIAVEGPAMSRCLAGELSQDPALASSACELAPMLHAAGLGSAVGAPLQAGGAVFGVLLVARDAPHAFGARDLAFVGQLAEHVALAAQQARLHAALQRSQAATLARERLAALGTMAGAVAHDINNALSPVALYVESMLARETGLSERGRSQLATIERAVDDVAATIAQLREFRRADDDPAAQRALDLNSVVRQAADSAQARWPDLAQRGSTPIHLQLDLDDALPAVRGVALELRAALGHLVHNAIDAMPDGGTLTLRTRRTDAGLCIEVADTGAGMDEATRQRCVEPFFSTKVDRGAGLGLSTVYGTAERHHARLQIDSAPGRGTTVALRFASDPARRSPPAASGGAARPPVADTVVAAVAPVAAAAAAPAPPLHVLVVDDDEPLRRSLAQLLGHDGHRVELAGGGRAAIAAAARATDAGDPFDVVVTDLDMPEVDGHAVAAAVKRLPRVPRVIMLTGWGGPHGDAAELPPDVDRLLAKPPRLADLRAALRASAAAPSTSG